MPPTKLPMPEFMAALEAKLVQARDLANQLHILTRDIGRAIGNAEIALREFRQTTLPLEADGAKTIAESPYATHGERDPHDLGPVSPLDDPSTKRLTARKAQHAKAKRGAKIRAAVIKRSAS